MGKLYGLVTLVVAGLSLVSGGIYAEDWSDTTQQELGSEGNPVKAAGVKGEMDYIEALDCENGAIPEYKRESAVGIGPYGNMMDKYVLRCDSGDSVEMYEIYMDAHHDETETEIVKGFSSWL